MAMFIPINNSMVKEKPALSAGAAHGHYLEWQGGKIALIVYLA